MKAINIWLTTKCNLNCYYCYERGVKDGNDISNDDVERIVDFIGNFTDEEENVSINFHGGEPLLEIQNIEVICAKLKALNRRWMFSMTTNGTLLDTRCIEIIKKYDINISVSIDGTKECHDKLRVDFNHKGSYEACIQGIKRALDAEVEIRGRMTITPDNCKELYQNIVSVYTLGIKNIVAVPDFYSKDWTEELVDKVEEDIRLLHKNRKDIEFVVFEETICEKGICKGGTDEINIDVHMDIYPCTVSVAIPEYKIGNIRENTWNSEIIDKIDAMNQEKLVDCQGCSFMRHCMTYRCRIFNKVLTGQSNRASDVICAFENMIYRINNNH